MESFFCEGASYIKKNYKKTQVFCKHSVSEAESFVR